MRGRPTAARRRMGPFGAEGLSSEASDRTNHQELPRSDVVQPEGAVGVLGPPLIGYMVGI